jgi:cyclic pyranopterin monophosphate synthase
MTDLSHIDKSGAARMVDVSEKAKSTRTATASGTIRMMPETLDAIRANALAKGDVIAVARIAGIQAAKRTAELIPLCHPLPLELVDVDISLDNALPGLRVVATARTSGKTGVEMEAMVAVAVTLVTIYDMAKSRDREMVIADIVLREKHGGRSGDWYRG